MYNGCTPVRETGPRKDTDMTEPTQRFYGNDTETYYVNEHGQPFLVQSPDMRPGTLFDEEVDAAALDGLEDVTDSLAPGEFDDAVEAIEAHVAACLEADAR